MNINTGISEKDRKKVVGILNAVLSDECLLYFKTRNYHWNVTGRDFIDLHKFFESQYEELDHMMDDTAERARSLGGHSLGTMKEFLQETRLKEFPGDYPDAENMITNLLADHETIIRKLRKDLEACARNYKDMGTSDYLTGLMEKHEKMAWMLRSYKASEWEEAE